VQFKHTDTRKSNSHPPNRTELIFLSRKKGGKVGGVGGVGLKDLTLAHQTRKTTLLNSFQSAYIISAKPKQKSNAKGAK